MTLSVAPSNTTIDTTTLITNTSKGFVTGTSGTDVIYNEYDNAWVSAGSGNDIIENRANGGLLFGGAGNDTIIGGSGHDVLLGGDGDDVLIGGVGNDVLMGGNGADTFSLSASYALNSNSFNSGVARITDFDASEGDVIQLDADLFLTVFGQNFSLGSTFAQSMVTFDSATSELSLAGQTFAVLDGVSTFDTSTIDFV